MKQAYKQLTYHERCQIADGLTSGCSYRAIAERIGRSPSTIQREVSRHRIKGVETLTYQASLADDLSKVTKRLSYKPRVKLGWQFETELGQIVLEKLKKGWSPEQIQGWLKTREAPEKDQRVCHETIYKAIYIQPRGDLRQDLLKALRKHHRNRMPRTRGDDRKSIIDMVNISERPPEVEGRLVPGHWEGDLIKGSANKSSVGTLIERTSRFCMLVKLESATTEATIEGFQQAFARVPVPLRKTMTYDQGREMAAHAKLSKAVGIEVYFCDPHSPWQRPSNENMNGLLREYLPKGTDLNQYSQEDLDVIAEKLNTRPRKVLGFKTPGEVFDSLLINNE